MKNKTEHYLHNANMWQCMVYMMDAIVVADIDLAQSEVRQVNKVFVDRLVDELIHVYNVMEHVNDVESLLNDICMMYAESFKELSTSTREVADSIYNRYIETMRCVVQMLVGSV